MPSQSTSPDERRPLLEDHRSNEEQREQHEVTTSKQDREVKPFPWWSFFILLLVRLVEPISFSVIFPFINPLIADLTGKPNSTGIYAGLIESLFMATQCLTLLYWGSASDKRGRKPILLIGLMGTTLSIVLFGLSKSLWWAILARCISGALNGNVAVVKSTVAELVPPRHHPVAFSCLSLCWSLGVTIGPAIGGFASSPAEQYPDTFGKGRALGFGGLWETYPYLLPCLISGSLTAIAIVLAIFQLPETLPRLVKQRQRQQAGQAVEDDESSESDSQAEPSKSTGNEEGSGSIKSIITNGHVQRVLLTNALFAGSLVGLDVMQILYFYEPVPLGGLHLTPSETGLILSICGLAACIVQLTAFPALQRLLGTLRLYQLCLALVPLSVAIIPFANVVARGRHLETVLKHDLSVWAFVAASNALKVLSGMAFPANMLLVNQSASLFTEIRLGTLNALAQMATSFARAIGPVSFSTLLSITFEKQLLHGLMAWIVLFVLSGIGFAVSIGIKDVEKMIQRGEIGERIEGHEDNGGQEEQRRQSS